MEAQPFNDLPLLPPPAALETHAVLKGAIAAHRELAELKGVGPLIPNQAVFIQAIGLQEARLSSEIENIVTTNDKLYKAFANSGQSTDPMTKEVLRYKDALWHGYEAVCKKGRPFTTPLFVEVVQMIAGHRVGVRTLPGTKLATPAGKVIYTPPEGEERIREKLHNLEQYLYAEDGTDLLIKLAVAHYQFEAIHPFYDGNGRTGRILNMLYLLDHNLLDIPVLYHSRYIIEHKADYYQGLLEVTRSSAWEPWILFMLEAIRSTALLTRQKILAVRELMDQTQERIRNRLPRIYSKELVELLFTFPYCKIHFVQEAGIASRHTASRYLNELERAGFLQLIAQGREKYFVNLPYLELLVK